MTESFKIIMPFYRLLYAEGVTNPFQLFSFAPINNFKAKNFLSGITLSGMQ